MNTQTPQTLTQSELTTNSAGKSKSTQIQARKHTINIAVCCEDSEQVLSAHNLAERLAIPYTSKTTKAFHYLLCFTQRGLELQSTGHGKSGSLRVDFLTGRLGYRLAHQLGKRQPLARAVGMKSKDQLYVIDATAGMGRDALILAKLGCRVLMLERSDVIASMLRDGMSRAMKSALLMNLIRERINLEQADAVSFLRTLSGDRRPDVIYLDPMHPQRKKSALVKKEMRIFRDVVGEDDDAGTLLESALNCALKRVVVKRPRIGESLPGPSPNRSVVGKSTRYDIYESSTA